VTEVTCVCDLLVDNRITRVVRDDPLSLM